MSLFFTRRSWLVALGVPLALALAALACAYAEVPITPAGTQPLATPIALLVSDTPAPTDTATLAPTATAAPPTAIPTTEVPPTAGPPTETATRVVEVTPSETPTAEPTSDAPTETPTPEGPAVEPSATNDPAIPTPTLAAIPPEATFTRTFTTTAEGDFPLGLVRALSDAQVSTWASLRNGRGEWLFALPGTPVVSGVRLYAHRDRDQDTTLLGIDISLDGETWIEVYTPTTSCGATPACAVIPQNGDFDIPFGPLPARHVRLRSGPTALALAEVQFALMP